MKILIRIAALLLLAMLGCYAFMLYQNNRETVPTSDAAINASYERSVVWLQNHREKILREANPMLWWMLGESARISGDARVQNLFDEFVALYDRNFRYDVWQAMFKPDQFRNARFSASEYESMAEYQQYFLYGLTCSEQLAQEPVIEAQHDTGFCFSPRQIYRPACVTHQLMAYRMAERNQCHIADLDRKIAVLQTSVERQLFFDPRVVDIYIQRALMLADSDAAEKIKPRWLERIIAAQLDDGGWSNMQPLINVGGRHIGFNATGLATSEPKSTFHATAQGLLLMSLLRKTP